MHYLDPKRGSSTITKQGKKLGSSALTLQGMGEGLPKPVIYNQLKSISQGSDENRTAFQLQLEEA